MYEHKRSVQPFLIVVAEELSNIAEVYICMDKTFYKLPSVIRALDTLFKLFHVLDTFYPPESGHLWAIIEQAVYEIKPLAGQPVESRTTEVIVALNSKRETSRQHVIEQNNDTDDAGQVTQMTERITNQTLFCST